MCRKMWCKKECQCEITLANTCTSIGSLGNSLLVPKHVSLLVLFSCFSWTSEPVQLNVRLLCYVKRFCHSDIEFSQVSFFQAVFLFWIFVGILGKMLRLIYFFFEQHCFFMENLNIYFSFLALTYFPSKSELKLRELGCLSHK